jgi:purine-binding chemotaxis protein CheW
MPSAVVEKRGINVGSAGGHDLEQERTDSRSAPSRIGDKAEMRTFVGDQRAGKYLTFRLGREEFAIRVLKVREIIGIQDITAVPHTPGCVKGVINLRGKVIPVVDLRLKFGLPEMGYTQRTCIIVVQVQLESVSLLMGIVVDEVSEVLNLAATDVEDTPDFGDNGGSAAIYLSGMAKVKGKVKILLDIDRVLCSHDLVGLDSLSEA